MTRNGGTNMVQAVSVRDVSGDCATAVTSEFDIHTPASTNGGAQTSPPASLRSASPLSASEGRTN